MLRKDISPTLAVAVLLIATMFGIFVGDLLGSYLHLPKTGMAFLSGIAAMKVSTSLMDGSVTPLGALLKVLSDATKGEKKDG